MTQVRRIALIAQLLWRPAWLGGLLEVPLLMAVSALVIFFVALPMKAPMDSISYELGAAYESSLRVPPGTVVSGRAAVDAATGFPVAPAPEAGESLAYTPDLVRLELQVTDDREGYIRDVVGANSATVVAGEGGLLDEDSALRMGVKPGDELVLLLPNVIDAPAIRIRVAGLLRPYPVSGDNSSAGVFVVPSVDLPAAFITRMRDAEQWPSVTKVRVVFEPVGAAAGYPVRTRMGAISLYLATLLNPLRLAALIGLMVSAIGLWGAVALRSFGHTFHRLRGRSAILTAIGSAPRQVSIAGFVPEALLAVGGMTLGGLAIQQLVFPLILRRTLQGPTLLLAVALMGGLLFVALVVGYRGMQRHLSGSAVVAELSAEEG
jgi:hypothetical protein